MTATGVQNQVRGASSRSGAIRTSEPAVCRQPGADAGGIDGFGEDGDAFPGRGDRFAASRDGAQVRHLPHYRLKPLVFTMRFIRSSHDLSQ